MATLPTGSAFLATVGAWSYYLYSYGALDSDLQIYSTDGTPDGAQLLEDGAGGGAFLLSGINGIALRVCPETSPGPA
jgi:hypothetical protein